MARGTITMFNIAAEAMADGTHDFDTNTYKLALITTLPVATEADPTYGTTYTEVTGGTAYTAGGATLTIAWAQTSGTATFRHTGGTVTWNQDLSGPTNVKAGIVYNTSNNKCVCFIDFTDDSGTTAISLQNGAITWTPEASNQRLFEVAIQ